MNDMQTCSLLIHDYILFIMLLNASYIYLYATKEEHVSIKRQMLCDLYVSCLLIKSDGSFLFIMRPNAYVQLFILIRIICKCLCSYMLFFFIVATLSSLLEVYWWLEQHWSSNKKKYSKCLACFVLFGEADTPSEE